MKIIHGRKVEDEELNITAVTSHCSTDSISPYNKTDKRWCDRLNGLATT